MVNGVFLKMADVLSGVLQGTVFGPIIAIYIADIDIELKYSKQSSFANDKSIYRSTNAMIDTFKLESDLHSTYNWTKNNNINLNNTKFQLIPHGKNDDIKLRKHCASSHELPDYLNSQALCEGPGSTHGQ